MRQRATAPASGRRERRGWATPRPRAGGSSAPGWMCGPGTAGWLRVGPAVSPAYRPATRRRASRPPVTEVRAYDCKVPPDDPGDAPEAGEAPDAPERQLPRDGLAEALALVGDRWTLLIVAALLGGPRRFGDLQAEVSGIAPNVLTQRLRALSQQGLVIASAYSERPPRFVYELGAGARELALPAPAARRLGLGQRARRPGLPPRCVRRRRWSWRGGVPPAARRSRRPARTAAPTRTSISPEARTSAVSQLRLVMAAGTIRRSCSDSSASSSRSGLLIRSIRPRSPRAVPGLGRARAHARDRVHAGRVRRLPGRRVDHRPRSGRAARSRSSPTLTTGSPI